MKYPELRGQSGQIPWHSRGFVQPTTGQDLGLHIVTAGGEHSLAHRPRQQLQQSEGRLEKGQEANTKNDCIDLYMKHNK